MHLYLCNLPQSWHWQALAYKATVHLQDQKSSILWYSPWCCWRWSKTTQESPCSSWRHNPKLCWSQDLPPILLHDQGQSFLQWLETELRAAEILQLCKLFQSEIILDLYLKLIWQNAVLFWKLIMTHFPPN